MRTSVVLLCALAAGLGATLVEVRADGDADAAKIAKLIDQLRDPDDGVRAAAADGLLASGAAAVAPLVAVLSDAASPSRREAARIVGLIGADATPALAALGNVVGDAKSGAQAEAATAIGRIAVAGAKPPASASPADKAIQAGLDWLARHQGDDGRWDCDAFGARCEKKDDCNGGGSGEYDIGVTGLALLSFLRAGETPTKGPHAANVDKGLKALLGAQDPKGAFETRSQHFIYNHGAATIAVCEAFRATGARSLAEPAHRALAFVLAARNPDAAWRYSPTPDGTNDTSVTAWMARVLDVASTAGFDVDPVAMNGALSWVDKMTDEKTGRTGYQQKGGPPARKNENLKDFPPEKSESITATALVVRVCVGRTRESDPFIALGETLLAQKPPVWSPAGGTIDLYYWMHGAEALHRLPGKTWDAWRKALVDALVPTQRKPAAGCARGSWDPCDPWASDGGRIWTTCAALLSLENAADDPARRPSLPGPVRTATWALEKAVKSPDAALRKAAMRALEAIHSTFKEK